VQSVEHILAVLESLSRADRQWIVEHLPDHAKSVLINELSNPIASKANHQSIETQTAPSANGESRQLLIERISPVTAASVLANEPLWIIVAILQSVPFAWAAQVAQALPTSIRPTVIAMQRDSRAVPASIVASLRNTLLRRCVDEPGAYETIDLRPRWRQWLDVLRSRRAA